MLQEYRTRLVADVVTGKLDVREAAERLPEGAGEEEPIDGSGFVTEKMGDNVYDAISLKGAMPVSSLEDTV